MIVFFFKQKTAYEMRISDWSSDVCSSDLLFGQQESRQRRHAQPDEAALSRTRARRAAGGRDRRRRSCADRPAGRERDGIRRVGRASRFGAEARGEEAGAMNRRSEEHTSELQSLMRITYAVFCLKKKN